MTAELRSPNGSMIARGFILAAIAITVVGAQFGFPWLSLHFAGALAGAADWEDEPASWSHYCSARMRFNSFFQPDYLPYRGVKVRSTTVCKDELIVLANIGLDIDSKQAPTDLIRFNLRTGQATTSPAPEGVRYVLSDGNQLWWLRGDKRITNSPCIWDGRPTVLVQSNLLYQFIDFIDGHWQESDRFALIPPDPGISVEQMTRLCSTTTKSYLQVRTDGDDFHFRIGVEVGSQEQARRFAERFRNPTNDELRQLGFHCIHAAAVIPGFMIDPCGRWLEGGVLCAIDLGRDTHGNPRFRWNRYEHGKPIESRLIPTPIRWSIDPLGYWQKGDGLTAITSVDGRVYILSHDDSDGRLHVLQWENGQLQLVAQRGDHYFGRVCLDGGLLFCLACFIPMVLLAFLAFVVQRTQSRLFVYGRESAVLASVVRRGVARSIDLGLVVLPLVLSIAMHPDAIGWWRHTSDESRHLFHAIEYLQFSPVVDSLSDCRDAIQTYLVSLVSSPILWWVFGIGAAVGIAQLIWQGRSGRTLGKWLMGIKVVRTTLRPCGVARSLLREIVLVIDSAMLFSWVPGVITILVTSKSQRIGDWMTDTIVVRDA